jgi:hypothetical protein
MDCLELLEGCDYQESRIYSIFVDFGVPQGTVLGQINTIPLPHNDLPDSATSSVRLFADDCLLYRTIKTAKDHQKLQADLEQLEIWAKDWGMRFNAKKCYILYINKKSNKFYSLDNHILQEVQDNPYLGLQMEVTSIDLAVRKFVSHLWILPFIPYWCNLWRSLLCGTAYPEIEGTFLINIHHT